MNQNAPKKTIGKIANVNLIKKISVINSKPKNFINESINIGRIKYTENFGKKNLKPTKRWSKILPNLVFTMLFKNFFITLFSHQTI
jgi:uncharacterized membrane protein SirB2